VKSGAAVLIASVCTVSAATATRADAQPSSSIVLESYEVRRPETADFPIGMLREEFGKLGYIASPPYVKQALGNQLAFPASEPPDPSMETGAIAARAKVRSADQKKRPPPNPRSSAPALYKELSNVHERWLAAKEPFETLSLALYKAASDALASPALVVSDQSIRNKLQAVMLDLALLNGKLAHPRAGGDADDQAGEDSQKRAAERQRAAKASQKEAEDWMAEWMRTYEDEEITQKKNGPEADELFNHVRDERSRLFRGTLSITVDDPNVRLYVNETIRSLRRPITGLSPGRYRALLMGPSDDARLFRLDILPSQTTHLEIDWSVSSNLVIAEWSVAFVFSSATHPEPATLACKLARKIGLRGVVLIGVDTIDKQFVATASLHSVKSCQTVRAAYTSLGASEMKKQLAALALFIAQGTRDTEVVVTSEDLSTVADLEPEPPKPVALVRDMSGAHRYGKWLAAGGSAAALAIGGFSLYRHYTCGSESDDCAHIYTNAGLVGYVATGAGVALGALSAYWFYQDSRAADRSRIAVTPSHAGAIVSWETNF
jgi:hypothetical protein